MARFDDFLAVHGTIAFWVGDRAWTLQFGDVESPVIDGALDGASLSLRFTPPAFDGFVDGTLDVGAAVGSGDVSAEGELELFEILSTFMLPVQRGLGWDAT